MLPSPLHKILAVCSFQGFAVLASIRHSMPTDAGWIGLEIQPFFVWGACAETSFDLCITTVDGPMQQRIVVEYDRWKKIGA